MSLRERAKLALATWVLHKRRGWLDGQVFKPTPQDEAMHPADGRRRFAEDHTFVGLQPNLALLARLEWLPGRELHRVWVVVLGDGEVWSSDPEGSLHPRVGHDPWSSGGLTLDCVEPLQRWAVRFRGPLHLQGAVVEPKQSEVDLEFVADRPVFVPGVDDDPELVARRLGEAQWDRELVRSVRRVTQRGYVQLGQIRGRLALGSRLLALGGPALRQHTWGVRDWGAAERALQCFACDSRHRAWIHQAKFPAFTLEGGFVDHDGQLGPMTALLRSERNHDRHRLAAQFARARAEGLERGHGSWELAGQTISRHELRVDGRGALCLRLVQDGQGTQALWAEQRRTLPWPKPGPWDP